MKSSFLFMVSVNAFNLHLHLTDKTIFIAGFYRLRNWIECDYVKVTRPTVLHCQAPFSLRLWVVGSCRFELDLQSIGTSLELQGQLIGDHQI